VNREPGDTTASTYGPRGFPQASRTLTPAQATVLVALVLGLVLGLLLAAPAVLLGLNAAVTVFYLVSTVYRIVLIDVSLKHRPEIRILPQELRPPEPEGWPAYLVLVPLYHEGAVLPGLVQALDRLEYPRDRLEIRLLIEADDQETRDAAAGLALPDHIVPWNVPVSQPRTKPKACNTALGDSDARYLVIYDAEDRPEPDQLKKAAVAFSQVPADVACIQGKLSFYNADRNLLTRCFTAEYATWFDLCLPGLDRLQAPIPLGGTSNHFRLDVLREVGGWDEYNVTEDCDLGIRLFASGRRTRILESITWEQACPSLRYWVKQRSRWVKGYIQTYLVHMRHPIALTRSIGWRKALHFHLLIGGTPFCQLVNPVYWLLALLWFAVQPVGLARFFPGPVFVMAATCLFVGNFVFIYATAIAAVRRGFGRLTPYVLLMPAYWALMSIGAWKGALQLITRPHHWEKTRHFSEESEPADSRQGGQP
jgi:cellulose synthase/poly-beta-1,6-N-acetylglucosamine synthase-like glycosyltransferase